jgi:anaerobic ribonucleoside-triphosphate reductase activating protein
MTTLLVNREHYPVTTLGPGLRAGIWTQGCSLRCPGCISRDTWEPDPRRRLPVHHLLAWLQSLPELDGITISGGEPFEQADGLIALLQDLRAWSQGRDPAPDVLVYSGSTSSALNRRPKARRALALADAVITGPYLERRSPAGRWRGSSNQRLIPLSDLGRSRYPAEESPEGDSPPAGGAPALPRRVQVSSNGERIWLIGVPGPGDLRALDQLLDRQGLDLAGASWRT